MGRVDRFCAIQGVAAAGLIGALGLLGAIAPASAQTREQPGQVYRVTVADLPRPGATPPASNPSRVLPRPPNATLQVPPGFRVNLFATGLSDARWLTVAPNGDVFLAEPQANVVTILRDADGDGVAEMKRTFVANLDRPHGLALLGETLFITTPSNIFRVPYRVGDIQATAAPALVGARNSLGDGSGHWTRNLAVSPDGQTLMIAVGSRGNEGEEVAPRASVQRMSVNGGSVETFGAGLRNPVGIQYRPGSNDLYVVVNERDGYGDGLVPDYLTRVQQGDFFGWPYAYLGANLSPTFGARRPDLVAATKTPDVLFESHSAPLGLVFYDGTQFPAEYRGDAFVALHGSWNSGRPTGYKVVRVPFRDGRPTGEYVNFVTGFWVAGTNRADVIGRPVGLAVARDGSLLIADDAGNAIWRISYRQI